MSCHQTSRPSVHGTSVSVRSTTRTCSIDGGLRDRLVGVLLHRRGLAAAELAVGGDQQLGLGVLDAGLQRARREAAEDDAVRRAEPRAGQHRDDGLGDHRQLDRDPVARLHAQLGQRVRGLAHLALQVGVGDRARCRRARPPSGTRPARRARPRRAGRRSCTATLSLPPTNHFANGGCQSSTLSHCCAQVSRSACSAQNASRSASARSYQSSVALACCGELLRRREAAALGGQVVQRGSRHLRRPSSSWAAGRLGGIARPRVWGSTVVREGAHGAPSVRAGVARACDHGGVALPTDPLAPLVALPGRRRGRRTGPRRARRAAQPPGEPARLAGDRGGGGAAGGAGVGGAGRCAAGPDGRRRGRPGAGRGGARRGGAGRLLGRLADLAAAGTGPAARARRRRPRRRAASWAGPGRDADVVGPARAARGAGDRAGRRPRRRWSSRSSTASCWRWRRSARRTAWWPGRRPGWRRWPPGWTRRGSRCRRSGTCGRPEYRAAAAGFAAGTADGVAAWVRHCCAQWEAGAREGRSIAEARA